MTFCQKGNVPYMIIFNNCPQPLLSFRAKNVTIYGTEYKIGAVVFLRAEMDYNLPEFGSILKIVILPSTKVFFYIKKFITLKNDNHFHAFQVKLELNPDITLIEQDQLATYLPAHTVRAFESDRSCIYVAPRFAICSV